MQTDYFVQTVKTEGYEFQTLPDVATNELHRVLVPRENGFESKVRNYPMSETSPLWREFAELAPTEKAIEAFASKYGRLSAKPAQVSSQKKEPTVAVEIGSTVGVFDRFDFWEAQIHQMKRLQMLWDLLREEQYLELEKHIIQNAPIQSEWFFVSSKEFLRNVRSRLHKTPDGERNPRFWSDDDFMEQITLPENFTNPTAKDAARHYLLENLNERLLDVRPKLIWDVSKPSSRHLDLMLIPESLIDALWLQFSQAVTRGTKFKRCAKCGKWFIVLGRNSQKKIYCDKSTCGQQAYRTRKHV